MCNCCRLCARSVDTAQPWTSLQCYFIRSFVCTVLSFTVICHWLQSTYHLLHNTTFHRCLLPLSLHTIAVTCLLPFMIIYHWLQSTHCPLHAYYFYSNLLLATVFTLPVTCILFLQLPVTGCSLHATCYIHMAVYMSSETQQTRRSMDPTHRLHSQIWQWTTFVRHNKHGGAWNPTNRLHIQIWLGAGETEQTWRSMEPPHPETALTDLAGCR